MNDEYIEIILDNPYYSRKDDIVWHYTDINGFVETPFKKPVVYDNISLYIDDNNELYAVEIREFMERYDDFPVTLVSDKYRFIVKSIKEIDIRPKRLPKYYRYSDHT